MPQDFVKILDSPRTPEVRPPEIEPSDYSAFIKGTADTLDAFALAKIEASLGEIEDKTENYYETAMDIRRKALNAPDLAQFTKFTDQLNKLHIQEMQGVLSPLAADARLDSLVRESVIRYPHLEDDILKTVTSLKAGSTGRKKADMLVDDPLIDKQDALLQLAYETKIPVPVLRDMAHKDYLLAHHKRLLEFQQLQGQANEGLVSMVAYEQVGVGIQSLWEVISTDGAGNPINNASYNTATASQKLEAAAQTGPGSLFRERVLQPLIDQRIPLTKSMLDSVYARWDAEVNNMRELVNDGNNFEVMNQRFQIDNMVALDTIAGGDQMRRLLLQKPEILNVLSMISTNARRAFTFGPGGTRVPNERGMAGLVAEAQAGVPDSALSLYWMNDQQKWSPKLVDDMLWLDTGVPPPNPYVSGTAEHGTRVAVTNELIKNGIKAARTPEEAAPYIMAGLEDEEIKRTLKKNPLSFIGAKSPFIEALSSDAFLGTEQGSKALGVISFNLSDGVEANVIRNQAVVPDLGKITRTGTTREAPFVFNGPPTSILTVPTGGAPGVGGVAIRGPSPGADAVRYLNEAYTVLWTLNPASGEAFLADVETRIRRATGTYEKAAQGAANAATEPEIIHLTDKDFEEVVPPLSATRPPKPPDPRLIPRNNNN